MDVCPPFVCLCCSLLVRTLRMADSSCKIVLSNFNLKDLESRTMEGLGPSLVIEYELSKSCNITWDISFSWKKENTYTAWLQKKTPRQFRHARLESCETGSLVSENYAPRFSYSFLQKTKNPPLTWEVDVHWVDSVLTFKATSITYLCSPKHWYRQVKRINTVCIPSKCSALF